MNQKPAVPVTQVFETREYDQFSIIPGNRPVNRDHVDRIKKSMEKNYMFEPIKVNKTGGIVDGQHRHTAAKELGLPLRYYVDSKATTKDVAEMNHLTKKWSHTDFAQAYSKQGNDNYQKYESFRAVFPEFSHSLVISLLSYKADRTIAAEKLFGAGLFEVVNYDHAIQFAETLRKIGNHFPGYNKRAFVFAVLKVSQTPGFKFETLIHKISMKSNLLKDYSQTSDYIQALEEVYNYSSIKSQRLRFY